jgi:iron complex transport system permease protein
VAAPSSPKAVRIIFATLSAITIVVFLLHIGYGSSTFLYPWDVIREILKGPRAGPGSRENDVVWGVRMVRGLACLCIGGILGGVGSAFQALFRNPLADPFIVGVSSGAATGSILAMLLGFVGGLWQAGFAFAGGLLSLGLVMALAGRRGATNVVTLLLSGVVIGSMLSGVLSLMILLAGKDSTVVLRWLLGDLDVWYWSSVGLLAFALVVGGAILISQTRFLNAFAIGEETARRLGVNTRRLKAIVLVTGAGMTAVAVGTAGIIGFLGLVAPHIARGLVGTDWRRSLAASMLVGSALLLIADVVAQRLIPAVTARFGQPVIDLPVGVVTALIGAPSLLILLRRSS